jgi:glycosyltransferase involved in cell wall biosynthesis
VLDQIVPLILTWNEEANIERVLDKLRWAHVVVVVDSGSSDRTYELCAKFSNVRFVVRPFDNHAAQWNYGLNQTGIASDWVLALDADYVLSETFIDELSYIKAESNITGYRMRFRYCINGRPLKGTLYPPVVGLYRRKCAHYVQDGHTQRVILDGMVADMKSFVFHDDRKPLGRWLVAQESYAQLECDFLLGHSWGDLRWQDRLRKLILITPWVIPLYCLTVGMGFLDGKYGLYYALQRGIAEGILSLKLLEAKFSGHDSK